MAEDGRRVLVRLRSQLRCISFDEILSGSQISKVDKLRRVFLNLFTGSAGVPARCILDVQRQMGVSAGAGTDLQQKGGRDARAPSEEIE